MKKTLQVLILSILSILLLGCSSSTQTALEVESADTTLTVATSFYPIYFLSSNIVGNADSVFSVIPNGAEPHSYEPTPQDLVRVYNSDLFIFNGAEMDPWAERIAQELISRGVRVVELSSFVDLLSSLEDDHHSHDHDDHHDHHSHDHDNDNDHNHGEFDPHFWLDPIIMISLAQEIQAILTELDSENASIFEQNTQSLIAQLQEIDTAFTAGLASCQIRDAVASHAAFQYLAARYNFRVTSISGISPEAEPSPARLAEISQLVTAKGINYIFYETLISPRVAETIARETGVQTLVFNPIEGLSNDQIANNENYITIMFQNLETLQTALNCS